MKRQEYKTITDLGWWKRLAERTDRQLEWWYRFEKDVRGQGSDLKEIRKRQRPPRSD